MADRELAHCYCPASQESIVLHAASLGKDQPSTFEVCFLLNVYCFHSIVSWKIVSPTIISQGRSVIFYKLCSLLYFVNCPAIFYTFSRISYFTIQKCLSTCREYKEERGQSCGRDRVGKGPWEASLELRFGSGSRSRESLQCLTPVTHAYVFVRMSRLQSLDLATHGVHVEGEWCWWWIHWPQKSTNLKSVGDRCM